MGIAKDTIINAEDFPGIPEEGALHLSLGDEPATLRLGRQIGDLLRAGGFVGLVGPLGAGKTTMMRGIQEGRGGDPQEVSSPTYSLVQVYGENTYHLDLYRLESVEDLESIGYWDLFADLEALLVVEWLDRIPDAWPGRGVIVELNREGTQREATVWGSEETPALLEALQALQEDP